MARGKAREARLRLRIQEERARMGLRVWEFAPAEVDLATNIYPPGTAGHDAWNKAAAQRREILAADPHHYDDLD